METQPEILMGIVGNQVAHFTRARWRLQEGPERFRCLESADPKVQLQAALAQIETLLKRNRELIETVVLLSQALDEAHSLNRMDQPVSQADRNRGQWLQLAYDVNDRIKLNRKKP